METRIRFCEIRRWMAAQPTAPKEQIPSELRARTAAARHSPCHIMLRNLGWWANGRTNRAQRHELLTDGLERCEAGVRGPISSRQLEKEGPFSSSATWMCGVGHAAEGRMASAVRGAGRTYHPRGSA